MNGKKCILFVSHAATRNGATILLLRLLRWLKDHTDYRLDILVNGSGELIGEFQSIGRTTIWRNTDRVFGLLPPGHFRSKCESQLLKLLMLGRSYDLVYLNTSSVAAHLPILSMLTRNVLWHIHELEYALRNSMGDLQLRQLFPTAKRFIAVSSSVRETLVQRFSVPRNKVDLVHGFVSVPLVPIDDARSLRRQIHNDFGWPENAFVVGGCGALGWRKGTDVFLQIAQAMLRSADRDHTRFLWVGGGSTDEKLRFEHDVHSLGLEDCCRYVPATAAVMDYYYAMDVFALTSREDPFPLVMLEAGACRLPVVCFADSGGGPEFVGDDSGLIAPYLDVGVFANHLQTLHDSPELRRSLGAAGLAKVRSQYTVEVQGPKLLASIERCLSDGAARIISGPEA
jgi:glycosyltransferase involved in cell wall biosynthesis